MIMSENGVEDVTPLHIPDDVNTTANTIASTITTTQSTTKALEHISLPKYNDGDDSDNSSSESKNHSNGWTRCPKIDICGISLGNSYK
jgi:hypothetical protein